jgi:ferredoxin-NADP reductase
MTWLPATLVDARVETHTTRTLVLSVPGWVGHRAGQHVDVRLTAEDGYQARRNYSLAGPYAGDERLELTVALVDDGEVSPYLVGEMRPGDVIEVRGPIGGWFAWDPDLTESVLLVAGGSGVVPLMAMIRAHALAGSRAPFRLLYSVRTPDDLIYADELRRRTSTEPGLQVDVVYTRRAAADSGRPPGRIAGADLDPTMRGHPASRVYVCGPTPFVEHAADLLLLLGQPAPSIRTERFGPTGG